MFEVKYNYNDKVSFSYEGEEYIGIVEIIDRHGYFFDNSEPYYDIFIENQNLLVKHVPQSIIRKVE